MAWHGKWLGRRPSEIDIGPRTGQSSCCRRRWKGSRLFSHSHQTKFGCHDIISYNWYHAAELSTAKTNLVSDLFSAQNSSIRFVTVLRLIIHLADTVTNTDTDADHCYNCLLVCFPGQRRGLIEKVISLSLCLLTPNYTHASHILLTAVWPTWSIMLFTVLCVLGSAGDLAKEIVVKKVIRHSSERERERERERLVFQKDAPSISSLSLELERERER